MPAEEQRRRRPMLDAERTRAIDKPVHRRTIKSARAAEAVGAGEPREQLEVHFLRQPPERAVADVASLVKHAGLEMMSDEADHLAAHVESVDRVDVEAIQHAQSGLHS